MAVIDSSTRRALYAGRASVAAAIAVPAGVLGRAAVATTTTTSAGCGCSSLLGAARPGASAPASPAWRQQIGAPLTHGIVTAVGVFVVVQTRRHRRAARSTGDDHQLGSHRCPASCCRSWPGTVGGAARRPRRPPAGPRRPRREHPRHRRRHERPARRRSCGPTPPSTTSHYRPLPPDTPFPGLVEFDAAAHGRRRARGGRARRWRRAARSRRSASPTSGPRPSCGTAPPASRSARRIGWQDLRTVGDCLDAGRPRASASRRTSRPPSSPALLDTYDPDRARDLCFGTVDTWLAWTLSGGALHVTDRSQRRRHRPARRPTARDWDDAGARRAAASRGDAAPSSSTRPA